MFKNLTNIQRAIGLYRVLAIISAIMIAIIVMGLSILYFVQTNKDRQNIYILNEQGEVFSASLSQFSSHRDIEAQAHVRLFIMLFFDIDKHNYESKINQSYDLGNSCIYSMHQKFVNDKWYTNMLQYNIIQTVYIDEIKTISSSTTSHIVNAKFKIHIRSEASKDKTYSLDLNFDVIEGKERTTNNPHALIINNIEVINFTE